MADAVRHCSVSRSQVPHLSAEAGEGGPGYREEVNDMRSRTESYIAMKVGVSNWRWAGVPFYLRTGKRMKARHSEIAIIFKEAPHAIFGQAAGRHQNILVSRLQPNEGMDMLDDQRTRAGRHASFGCATGYEFCRSPG